MTEDPVLAALARLEEGQKAIRERLERVEQDRAVLFDALGTLSARLDGSRPPWRRRWSGWTASTFCCTGFPARSAGPTGQLSTTGQARLTPAEAQRLQDDARAAGRWVMLEDLEAARPEARLRLSLRPVI